MDAPQEPSKEGFFFFFWRYGRNYYILFSIVGNRKKSRTIYIYISSNIYVY